MCRVATPRLQVDLALTAGEIKRQFAEKALADKARLEADVGADDVSGGDAKASGRSSN